MAGNKYQTLVAGVETLIAATQTSAGVADADKIVALDSAGRLDATMMPVGVGADVKSMVTSENLAVGNLVNIYSNVGVVTARKADNTNTRPAHGFVLAATTSPASAITYLTGINNQLSGMTIGARQYLSAAGVRTETPVASGIHQYLGIAISATELEFESGDYIVL